MKVRVPMYAVVTPEGEVLNCWTSPNRLYDTRPAAVKVRNQFIRDAEDALKNGAFRWCKETPAEIKRNAPLRQQLVDELKATKVLMVYIEVAEQ